LTWNYFKYYSILTFRWCYCNPESFHWFCFWN